MAEAYSEECECPVMENSKLLSSDEGSASQGCDRGVKRWHLRLLLVGATLALAVLYLVAGSPSASKEAADLLAGDLGSLVEEDITGDLPGGDGQCDTVCENVEAWTKNVFTTITGLDQLYFIRKGAPQLGMKNRAKRAIIVLHSLGVNPDRYLCYMYNGLLKVDADHIDNYIISMGMVPYTSVSSDDSSRRRAGVEAGKVMYWGHDSDDAAEQDSRAWIFGDDSKLPEHDVTPRMQETLKKEATETFFKPDLDYFINRTTGEPDEHASSFTVVDQLMKILNIRKLYPDLQEIFLVGHGAAAQFVQRYAVGNNVDPLKYHVIKYFVANPPTFMYLTEDRPVLPEIPSGGSAQSVPCEHYDPSTLVDRVFEFAPANMTSVEAYTLASDGDEGDWGKRVNDYPFGTESLSKYLEKFANIKRVRERYIERHVVYLVSNNNACNYYLQNNDNTQCGWCCTDPSETLPMDGCTFESLQTRFPLSRFNAAMAQGLTRVERAYGYWAYLLHLYGHYGNHEFYAVDAKHSACEIFQAPAVAEMLFLPKSDHGLTD